jgi:hypothetical protein
MDVAVSYNSIKKNTTLEKFFLSDEEEEEVVETEQ